MELHEVLFELLPAEGDWLSHSAAVIALSERTNAEVDEDAFARCIWQLGSRIVWSAHDNLLRRRRDESDAELPQEIRLESDIEPWFEQYIWRNALRVFYDPPPASFNVVVQNTARIGPPSGRWTRPDVCMICISRYQYWPSAILDLFSFELKMPSGCNALAVHEALAHSAAAHFPYLCVWLPPRAREAANLPSMLEQAQRHGVGIIRIGDVKSFESYELLLSAQRHAPSPAKIDGFIDQRFEDANRLAVRKWVRL